MRIELLRARNLRCFENIEFAPSTGINWLVGWNGAGKTTLLEAAYILSRGRTFRSGGRAAPLRSGATEYSVYATVATDNRVHRLGLTRLDGAWEAHLDGEGLATLAPLFESCPVVCFEPESHLLTSGPAEERRRFLDWGVFHVEHDSLALWRNYRRVLRHRNALLRTNASDAEFEPWEQNLSLIGEQIDRARRSCLESVRPYFVREADKLVPELGGLRITYHPGWNLGENLREQLALQRDRDRARGYTHSGPHRADWSLAFEGVVGRDHLSRGQAKAIALVCVLAQTEWLKARTGEFPLLCLDDPNSELDPPHVVKIIDRLAAQPIQVWLTSTAKPDPSTVPGTACLFHVEPSGIQPMSA